jgi:hypothetical protein
MLSKTKNPVASQLLLQLQDALQSRSISVLYLISSILCLSSGYSFAAFTLLICCFYANPVLLWKFQQQYRGTLQRWGLNPLMLTGAVLGLLGGLVVGIAFAEPSHAQFFNNAENFVKNAFSATGASATTNSNIIALVMDTLRMLFVMYMLFGLVQVFQAVRQGEEWKDLARTPFFVVLAGTLGDVLVGAIAGTTATTATPVPTPSVR